MVNGRLLQLTGDALKNYLQSLKADDIKRVEVIAHPPAEYDAEGAGGLINIILKKSADASFTANIGTDYSIGLGRYPSYRPNVSFDYRKGKLNMSGGYNYSWTKNFQDIQQERQIANGGECASVSNSVDTVTGHSVRFSALYDISGRQFIAFQYSGLYSDHLGGLQSLATIDYPQIENNTVSTGRSLHYNIKVGKAFKARNLERSNTDEKERW